MDTALTLLGFGLTGWGSKILEGTWTTVRLALATLPLGLAIGFAVALAKQSRESSLRMAADIYTTIFRGLPELLTLFLVYYGAQDGIKAVLQLFNPGATVEINRFAAGMVALGAVFSAYAAETFQSAFRAIARGQYEGGYAIGLSKSQTLFLVILPQLIRIALPGLGNLWMVLLKETALVSVIGLADILRQAGVAARVTKQAFLFFGVAALIYLLLAILSSFAINAIDKYLKRGEAGR